MPQSPALQPTGAHGRDATPAAASPQGLLEHARSTPPAAGEPRPTTPVSGVRSPLGDVELALVDAYWRAANYLSVGQIYLMANPLLTEPLRPEHVKPRLLGHWGTTPGLNLVYAHLNRVIKAQDLEAMYVIGPGHGGPGIVANAYLEGTYSEVYPQIGRDTEGLRQLFRQFSFPGGIPSHVAPETPGSIHEGGELGYALVHAYGAAFDNPGLVVACVVGDGEAETGPLAASWHSNKFVDPARDGAVLPILHLNGYKIANPTVLARIPEAELVALLTGYGHRPILVTGDDPALVHQAMAAALDDALDDIAAIRARARAGDERRPAWPMIVLRTPKGWTGPKVVDGVQVEGTWRAHQVPLAEVRTNPEHLAQLEAWMRSYRPQELFTPDGALLGDLAALAPVGERRMSASPHANGGALLQDLLLPDFRDYAVDVPEPAAGMSEATRVTGAFLRDVVRANPRTFRVMGPDETASNRLTALFEATDRSWDADTVPGDDHLAPGGRVMEVLSEHLCQGWLEGYLLTGRHGMFNCYEAFVHIIDSMLNQHAKWLKVTSAIPWRRPIASLNYLLSSHVWRQDNNGFSHQDPGFIDLVVNKKAGIARVYLPPDTNTLLSTVDHCLRSRDYINVIVAGKQPALTYLSMDEAVLHCTRGLGIWEWASNDGNELPDVVMACAGDIPTLETLAAVAILRERLPELRVRVLNVVDLMRLEPDTVHPHGLPDAQFDALFTHDRPVIFAYHGYPALIHRLTYRRSNHANLHVRGYQEEGTTTTPFDMVMMNDLDRFHLVMDVIDRVPSLQGRMAHLRQEMVDARVSARAYTREHGEDPAEISGWTWQL
jgi:xylulose-5-phosphate/fructose-6-phosphate phosphoketolase